VTEDNETRETVNAVYDIIFFTISVPSK
jgi:hypothetical protein